MTVQCAQISTAAKTVRDDDVSFKAAVGMHELKNKKMKFRDIIVADLKSSPVNRISVPPSWGG
uniref:Uncharacterized protein n=1 Tax=Romanomermis culicivorax TaxID=13658 RepID=A0A915HW67_ROMCU